MQKVERVEPIENDATELAPPQLRSLSRATPLAKGQMPAPLSDFVRMQVGKRTLSDISDEIRRCMLVEAVRLNRGNITKTASMLGLTRQAVQQMLSNLGLKDWASELREVASR